MNRDPNQAQAQEDMINDMREAWGWRGIDPAEVINSNAFGNVIVKDKKGRYWRISPEELKASVIADSDEAYSALLHNKDFVHDWNMGSIVEAAEKKHGPVSNGRCFCLKIPAALGGHYDIENTGTVSIRELIRFSGDVAQQIEDMPDGTKIEFRFAD